MLDCWPLGRRDKTGRVTAGSFRWRWAFVLFWRGAFDHNGLDAAAPESASMLVDEGDILQSTEKACYILVKVHVVDTSQGSPVESAQDQAEPTCSRHLLPREEAASTAVSSADSGQEPARRRQLAHPQPHAGRERPATASARLRRREEHPRDQDARRARAVQRSVAADRGALLPPVRGRIPRGVPSERPEVSVRATGRQHLVRRRRPRPSPVLRAVAPLQEAVPGAPSPHLLGADHHERHVRMPHRVSRRSPRGASAEPQLRVSDTDPHQTGQERPRGAVRRLLRRLRGHEHSARLQPPPRRQNDGQRHYQAAATDRRRPCHDFRLTAMCRPRFIKVHHNHQRGGRRRGLARRDLQDPGGHGGRRIAEHHPPHAGLQQGAHAQDVPAPGLARLPAGAAPGDRPGPEGVGGRLQGLLLGPLLQDRGHAVHQHGEDRTCAAVVEPDSGGSAAAGRGCRLPVATTYPCLQDAAGAMGGMDEWWR
ncbi:hypothetical protein ON010_g1777 [Phytophthora cinnamomi]|nr:hypothetical protein ON010_g1777 [Phytophthora cinnamomi]